MAKLLVAQGKVIIFEVNLNKEAVTSSGIVIPSKADKESQSQALVVSVGPDVKIDIKEGDTAIISRVGGEVFNLGGRDFYALKEEDVFAVIKEVD